MGPSLKQETETEGERGGEGERETDRQTDGERGGEGEKDREGEERRERERAWSKIVDCYCETTNLNYLAGKWIYGSEPNKEISTEAQDRTTICIGQESRN